MRRDVTKVLLSTEEYESPTNSIEMKLDEADRQAERTEKRVSHDAVFGNARRIIRPDIK